MNVLLLCNILCVSLRSGLRLHRFPGSYTGGIICYPGLREVQICSKSIHCFRCSLSIDSICSYPGHCRISFCNPVDLFLKLSYLNSCRTDIQIIAWPGSRNSRHLFCHINIYIIAIKNTAGSQLANIPDQPGFCCPTGSSSLCPGTGPGDHHNTE